jgi:hypothetical protein
VAGSITVSATIECVLDGLSERPARSWQTVTQGLDSAVFESISSYFELRVPVSITDMWSIFASWANPMNFLRNFDTLQIQYFFACFLYYQVQPLVKLCSQMQFDHLTLFSLLSCMKFFFPLCRTL